MPRRASPDLESVIKDLTKVAGAPYEVGSDPI
jgi:hypothetical protein